MKCYFVDAFTDRVFEGNPAGVCIIKDWISDKLMRNIAMENNLSETAFAVKEGEGYRLRWFTPAGEVDLCGHATLAAAYVILRFYEPELKEIRFETLSGVLTVGKEGDMLCMDFPSFNLKPLEISEAMINAVGFKTLEAYMGEDMVLVLESEEQVKAAIPKQDAVKELEGLLLHITAKGGNFDCVTRSFAPKCNVQEDPVCGRGHCHVIPLWSKKLGKTELKAYQASKRGGRLLCEYREERTVLKGKAVLYSEAELYIEETF